MSNEQEQLDLFGSPAVDRPNPDLIPTDAKIPIPPGTYQTMEPLDRDCGRCYRCELGNTRTHAVVGRGNLQAPIMIIGEGPGENEDKTGLPFVGQAGKLLEKILASVNLTTEEDVYIGNVVKCCDGNTKVLTKSGYKRLSSIVDRQWSGEVLSADDRGNLVWKKVTNWYKSRLAGRALYQVNFKSDRSIDTEGYIATEDHPILTARGWITVAQLGDRDLVATGMPASGSTGWQRLFGTLLDTEGRRQWFGKSYLELVERLTNQAEGRRKEAGRILLSSTFIDRVLSLEELANANDKALKVADKKTIFGFGETEGEAVWQRIAESNFYLKGDREEPIATDWQPVNKKLLPAKPDSYPVYCIDVEDTANFVTPGGVVHNCRPPGNRVPTTEEIEACRPYLLEQIRLVDPKIILLTGATAVKGLTGDKRGITKIRGTWIEWEGRLCMPILHPAYLLRNPSRDRGSPKWLMWQDIQAVRAKLDEIRSQ
jgi:uracil-DNA glycosylase family 4